MARRRAAFRPQIHGLESRVALSTTAVIAAVDQQIHLTGSISFYSVVYHSGLEVFQGSGTVSPLGLVRSSAHFFTATRGHPRSIILAAGDARHNSSLWLSVAPDAFAHTHHAGTYELLGFFNHSAVKVFGNYTIDQQQKGPHRDPLRGQGILYTGTLTFGA